MIETVGLKTRSGFTFTVDTAGPAGGALVLLLHGFPESRHSWRAPAIERLRPTSVAIRRAPGPIQRICRTMPSTG
jgi:pimeloyl-ACP methyl ester carboxylesterase